MFHLQRLPSTVIPYLFAIFVAMLTGMGIAAAADNPKEESVQTAQAATGGESCIKCHDEPPATLVLHTAHAQMADPRTPFADEQCISCHGPSKDHLQKPAEGEKRLPPDVLFGRMSPTPAAEQNAVCLGCHEGGIRLNWAMTQHSANDVGCATCHDVHALKDKVQAKATQTEICFECHTDKRAQSFKRSRHPLREGIMSCSDCHNPHGSFGPTQLVKNTINETCFQCHAEKRGPFLWEHAPVSDDCTNCHNPHGSAQPRMLTVRTPFLCQMCHSETFHPSTLYSGEFLPDGPNPGSSTARLVAKGCLNCHPKVHGTNHPSGVRLTR